LSETAVRRRVVYFSVLVTPFEFALFQQYKSWQTVVIKVSGGWRKRASTAARIISVFP
jgi:hypothetical protein